MVSVIPSARSPLDAIMENLGPGLSQVIPRAMEQYGQRQRSMAALDQAQQEIAQAGGDPMKLALAFARVQAMSPEAARGMGPVFQTAIQSARTGKIFPPSGEKPAGGTETTPEIPSARPTPYNLKTPQQIDQESREYAIAQNDPNAYATRQAQLVNANEAAKQYRTQLEDMAIKANVPREELPEFLQLGEKFPTENPTQWFRSTYPLYREYKSNKEKLQRAFIPGLGSALLGRNREEALKRIEPSFKDLSKMGFEQEARNLLAENFVSPTEISEIAHPIQRKTEVALKKLPKGTFPSEKGQQLSYFGRPEEKVISGLTPYETAIKTAPKEMKQMQDRLAKFFKDNVDKDTSILGLRDKLWNEKDYDWRQIGPALRQAMAEGLELEPFQMTEMTDIETQPPRQSLPDIFQDWSRIIPYFKGEK